MNRHLRLTHRVFKMITDLARSRKLINAKNAAKCDRGFSLIETLVAVSILGISVASISMLLFAGMRQNQVSDKYLLAANLAQNMMDEVLGKPFYDPDSPGNFTPGPDAGEGSRGRLDNIDDYDGLAEPAGGLLLPDEEVLDAAHLSAFSRNTAAEYVYLPGQDSSEDPTFILVVVQVFDESALTIELRRLISSAEQQIE